VNSAGPSCGTGGTGAEREEIEEGVVDAAAAARTLAELDGEVTLLGGLVELATRVRRSGTDKKWTELRSLLLDEQSMYGPDGTRRKIIIFTEHRDTLNYLVDKIRDLLGRDEAVVAIHGGVRREARRAAQEVFTSDKGAQVLVATDAAGEGLDLQRARLMVNYDLPWNPNRIEQRFAPHPPHRAERGVPAVEPGRRRHPRGCGVPAAAGQDGGTAPRVQGQGLQGQGLRRAGRGVRGPAAAGAADRGDPLRRPNVTEVAASIN
jgi:hypothetical protein